MGFWNDYILDKNPIVMTSKAAGKGLFQTVKKITGSDKMAASIQQGGDPFNLFTNGKNMTPGELGVSEDEATNIRRGQQAGRLTSMLIAAIYGAAAYGGALAVGGSAAGEGGGAAAGSGAGGAGGFSEMGIGDYLAAEGAGEGAGVGSSAGGFNWQNLVKNMAGKGGQGAQQGGGLSLPSIIAQQQVTEAARQAQEMLGGDTDLINYIARMQMQNNLRRVG